MRNYLAAILVSCVFVSAQAQHDQGGSPPASKADDTFSLIKALVGDWQGSYEWIGKNRKGPMNARYYLTGNGTAVVEDLIVDGNANMTTVYHLHGADLRATHYCAAGNQPRLKATPTEDDNKVVKFHMVDITNLPTPRSGPCQRSRAAIDQCHGISDQLASELPLLMGFPPIPVLATRLS